MGILSLVTKNNDGVVVNMAMGYTGNPNNLKFLIRGAFLKNLSFQIVNR